MTLRAEVFIFALLFLAVLVCTWVIGHYLWLNWGIIAIVLGALYMSGGGFFITSENTYVVAIALGAMTGLTILIVHLALFS